MADVHRFAIVPVYRTGMMVWQPQDLGGGGQCALYICSLFNDAFSATKTIYRRIKG
jgi:hypothetical protein